MAEKELRKLNRRELLKLLLIQCEEMERLQQEYDEMKTDLETFTESYERLRSKLNVKDARLNQKDAKIAELTGIIEEMKAAKAAELPQPETAAEAYAQLNRIFEEAQKKADQYLQKLNFPGTLKEQETPFEPEQKSKSEMRQSLIVLGRRSTIRAEPPGADKKQGDVMHG